MRLCHKARLTTVPWEKRVNPHRVRVGLLKLGIGTDLVGGWVFAEANIPVYAEDDILDWKLRNCLVDVDGSEHGRVNERLPVLEGSPVLAVVCCSGCQTPIAQIALLITADAG